VKKIPTVIPVVALALIDGSGRVLMQRRRIGAEHGGLWEFPGGKVEAGETLAESLCREICEELGLALKPEALEPLTFAAGPDQPHVILLYTCRNWQGEPACLDGEEIGWFSAEALPGLAMPPLDVPLAKAVLECVKSVN
jgi:8-oxo-dGTP diphosphatase